MRLFIYSVVFSAMHISSFSQNNFLVKGRIEGISNGVVYLSYIRDDSLLTDSATLKEGAFTFSDRIAEPVLATIRIKNRPLAINFFIDPGTSNLDLSFGSPPEIQGGPTQAEYKAFIASVRDVLPVMSKTYNTYWNLDAGAVRDSTYDLYLSLQKELKRRISGYVNDHDNSLVGAWAVADNYYNAASAEIKELYDKLTNHVRQSYYGRKVKELYETTDKSSIGKELKDFIAQDPEGRSVSIGNMQASYILIDFWASWCLPCRKENPHLKEVYRKYQNKGFEIVGFSLDDDKENWMRAIKNDGISWLNISDLKGWGKSEVCDELGINNVPMNILIDKNKIVIARNLRGNDLDRFLSALFAN